MLFQSRFACAVRGSRHYKGGSIFSPRLIQVLYNAGAPQPGRKPKRVQGYEGGERARYFADDDAADLAMLVKRQRHDGTPDLDANLADSILRKGARFRCGSHPDGM